MEWNDDNTDHDSAENVEHPWYGDDTREPFPPAPPLLRDHPYVRITQSAGLLEEDFDPTHRTAVPLTRIEIRTLAQHHLDKVASYAAFRRMGGYYGSSDTRRDVHYRNRFSDMMDLLPEEDREKFREIIAMRERYIDTLYDPEEGPAE